MSRLALRHFLCAFVLLCGLPAAHAQTAPSAAPRVAIKGYDPVSYFDVHHPEKGSAAFVATFDDAAYWFVSAAHRALFVADPDKYAPQYSGFCTMSVSVGERIEPNPESWTIANGKLYLFGEPPPGDPPAVPYFRQHTAEVVDAANLAWATAHKSR